ncbi:MAG TPA: efflux RND transporter permease subunit [Sedimentisphaerales bacterium]|nr:efflux RND transporter permease subunit [Sedimentisphaerales bacterium]
MTIMLKGENSKLVVVILFLLLWDLRAALTVALSLPLTAAATFILMDWADVSANLMSLEGLVIAVGMAVEDGLVLISFCDQLRREGRGAVEAVFEACRLRHPAAGDDDRDDAAGPAADALRDRRRLRTPASACGGDLRRPDPGPEYSAGDPAACSLVEARSFAPWLVP